tara:strand:+ start:195 stop:539 length:345 start_codon:yes stop_codon:yes gene_type:complete
MNERSLNELLAYNGKVGVITILIYGPNIEEDDIDILSFGLDLVDGDYEIRLTSIGYETAKAYDIERGYKFQIFILGPESIDKIEEIGEWMLEGISTALRFKAELIETTVVKSNV